MNKRGNVFNSCFLELLACHFYHNSVQEHSAYFTAVNKLSLYPALCTSCQEKEQPDFSVTLLGFNVPRQYCFWDFGLGPDMLCPVQWALLCLGSAGSCSANSKNYRAWIPFPSFFILLYLSFYPPLAHCKQWFPFLFILLLTHVYSLDWFSFGSDLPFSSMLLFCCLL